MKKEPQQQNTKRDEARASIPDDLRPVFDQLANDYRFAAMKHHGAPFVSYVVLAELVRMGWRCVAAATSIEDDGETR
jgi:hypothetical protein